MSRTPPPVTAEPDTETETDVLVVGAGPAGLLLAGDLAEAGARVTLVERRAPGRSNLTRAFVVHARTLEQLDARGLADDLLATGRRLDRLDFFGRLTVDPSRLRSRFPYVLVTPQYEVERLLERRAVAAGVTFHHETLVTGVVQDAAGVLVRTRPADGAARGADPAAGAERGFRAAYAVGADGHRSTVREAIGLPFPGRSVVRSMVLADVRLRQEPSKPFTANASAGALAVVASFGDGWYRTMSWNRERQLPDSEPAGLDEVGATLRQVLGTDLGLHDPRWISRFHSDERQVPRYRVGRVFLAGDAAHVHSPAGGMGMNTGLQDAANLGWKLAAALRGQGGEELLDSYHLERHPVGRTVLRMSGALVGAATVQGPVQRSVRGLAVAAASRLRTVRDRGFRMVSGIGISYPAPRGAHPLTGRRAPDVRLADGGRLYERLRGGSFVLLTPEAARPALPHDTGHLRCVAWRGDRRTAVLVRPDGYVAWAASDATAALHDGGTARALFRWTGVVSGG
ncbi:FAD-dependent monooxygenase [Streptomyces sp. NPDC059740]|uniref:FAD-dependent monooxygenase n=1 Tax=Streptomyces sp. NPDC059740 TaxID=3346926 RepID=UPI00364851A7